MIVRLKRVYEKPADDGYRILVDRLWPRGISKDSAKIDLWLKEVGPSNELRRWFGHIPEKFTEFASKYRKELESNIAFPKLKEIASQYDKVTLVYSAKDESHNQAVVLAELLNDADG